MFKFIEGNKNMINQKLNVGDKYLSVIVLGQIKLAAFKNQNKDKLESPDYIGNGIAIWVNTKKESIETNSL